MRHTIIGIVCLAFAVSSIAKVVELTSDNFDSVVDFSKPAFVEFYAPWCGHCKRLEPEYNKVGDAFDKIDSVIVAKVDADQHKDLAGKYGVKGFPTLKWFGKGADHPEDYNGGREAEDIIKYINQHAGTNAKVPGAGPSDVVVLTPSNFDSIVKDTKEDVLVEFYAPWCGHCKNLAPVWEKLATAFRNEDDVVVAKLDADAHKDLAGKYEVSGFPTLKFFPKDNKDGEKYEGSRDLNDLIKFLNERTGSHRTADGKLDETVGVFPELVELAKTFLSDASSRADTLKQVEAKVAALDADDQDEGELYVKLLKAVEKNGVEYVEKEIQRISRLLESSVNAKKADEFTVRLNILKAWHN